MTRRTARIVRLVLGVALLASFQADGNAQTRLRAWDGPAGSSFGSAAASAGDVDGDGLADVILDEGGTDAAGHVHLGIYSSRTGARLLDLDLGTTRPDRLALSSFTDVDGDGVTDLLVGSVRDASVTAFSGADGAEIWKVRESAKPTGFGFSIDVAGDFDGDGVLDVVVGDPWLNYSGTAHALSGRDGASIHEFAGFDGSGSGGYVVRGAGDLDGDGVDDWVAAAPSSGINDTGALHILSGADGSEIDRIDGPGQDHRFGVALAVGPDVNGDGVDDLVVGTSFDDGWSSSSEALLYSGADRTFLHSWNASDQLGEGDWLALPGDLDGDGRGEIVFSDVADLQTYVYSGATYAPIATIDSELQPDDVDEPWSIHAVATDDVDGDAVADLVLRMEDGGGLRVRLWSIWPAPFADATAPIRAPYDAPTPITIVGQNFTGGGALSVAVDGVAATNVVVLDAATLTCDTPPLSRPGRKVVTVASSLGGRPYGAELLTTPVITTEGEPTPGATVTLHFLVERGDDAFAVYGLGPAVSIPTPPFVGELAVLPFFTLFLFRSWIADSVDLDLAIPNDPALVGLDVLFQVLSGPHVVGRAKSGAWSDAELLAIR